MSEDAANVFTVTGHGAAGGDFFVVVTPSVAPETVVGKTVLLDGVPARVKAAEVGKMGTVLYLYPPEEA